MGLTVVTFLAATAFLLGVRRDPRPHRDRAGVVTEGLGRPASYFGVLMSVQGAGSVVGGLTVARLVGRTGEQRAAGLGLGCLALGAALQTGGLYAVVLSGAAVSGVGVPWLVVAFATAW